MRILLNLEQMLWVPVSNAMLLHSRFLQCVQQVNLQTEETAACTPVSDVMTRRRDVSLV